VLLPATKPRLQLQERQQFVGKDLFLFHSQSKTTLLNYDEIPPVTLETFTIRAAPFVAVEAIARAYDIKISYEKGVWVLRRSMDMEMARRLDNIDG
jgi:hypothetical protein